MPQQGQPRWQPISSLPLFAKMIDDLLENAQENQINLDAVRHRPHLVDDHTVNRVIKTYTEYQEDLWLYDEQLARWQSENLDLNQRHEVERLGYQVERLRQTLSWILSLAGELKAGTIEQVLSRDDADLATDLFTSKRNL
jgi:hypothetical protein